MVVGAAGMTRESLWRWSPAVVLIAGAIGTLGVDRQTPMPLRAELADVVPAEMEGLASRDIVISDQELRVAGVSTYLMREYAPASTGSEAGQPDTTTSRDAAFSVYIGYYASQTHGKTIHSPKNCLPGAGWEALQSQRVMLDTPIGPVPANRYLLQRDEQRALVVYWYQGRGRVEASEYVVKAQLLRDAALLGRTEEALVRIVVPIVTTEEDAFAVAASAATTLIPSLERALPAA